LVKVTSKCINLREFISLNEAVNVFEIILNDQGKVAIETKERVLVKARGEIGVVSSGI